METKKSEEIYTVDLTKIKDQKNGIFPCPKCGTIIDPADETEETYQIIETKVKDDELESLLLQCQNCKSSIRLIGFLVHPK